MAVQGVYQSPGVYRNPQGALYQSKTGALPTMIPKAKPKPTATTPGSTTTTPTQKFSLVSPTAGGALTPDQVKYNNLLVKIKNGKASNADMHERNRLYNLVANPNVAAPTTTQTAPAPAPAITPLNTQPLATAAPAPQTGPSAGTVNTLFPSTRMFEPQNYEGSPMYKFQLQEGQKQLSKSLAARGLTNSGRGIEEELNIPLRVAAQDTDRITRVASENADRLKSFQDNEALRQERAGNNQWDRAFSVAELMAQQSPWAASLAGLNNTADLSKMSGEAQANYLRDAYQRIISSGGGGGGGSSGGGSSAQPVTIPTGPNLSNIVPQQIVADNSSNNGWLNLITKTLAGLL